MFKYPPIIDFRWWITDISKEVTPTGLKLKVITNTDVNLFMVWTDIEPILEERWKMKRGVKVHCDPIFHLNNPQLVDEDVPEDHRVHYFTFDDWPVCQTRWFYFIAKVWVLWTKSTSFLHSYHKTALPQWHIFRPDEPPGITCSSGYVFRKVTYAGEPWANIHGGAGTFATDRSVYLNAWIGSGQDDGMWYQLHRSGLIFDTSSLPRPGIAQTAYVMLWGRRSRGGDAYPNFKVGLTAYDQDDNTLIALADYHHFLPYEASTTKMPFENFKDEAWNRFDLTDFQINAIREKPIREFGLREMTYDFANREPTWKSYREEYISFSSANAGITLAPRLYVNWIETGG